MKSTSTTILLLSVLLCLTAPVATLAWGPISHYFFACGAAYATAVLQPQPELTPLLIGSDLPDGMWNGWFLDGTKCVPQANHMHSPIFGGYAVQIAMQNTTYNQDPYFLSLAYGYASHPIADAVGFATQGGYLGNESAIINWELEWPFMLSVDAYVLNNWVDGACPMPQSLPKQSLDQKGIDFLAYVNSVVNAAQPTFPLLNSSQIADCSNPWGPQVNELNAWAGMQSANETAQQLIFFDRFGATDEATAVANMEQNTICVGWALTFYFKTISNFALTPLEAYQQTQAYIDELYQQGQCVVPPSSSSTTKAKAAIQTE